MKTIKVTRVYDVSGYELHYTDIQLTDEEYALYVKGWIEEDPDTLDTWMEHLDNRWWDETPEVCGSKLNVEEYETEIEEVA